MDSLIMARAELPLRGSPLLREIYPEQRSGVAVATTSRPDCAPSVRDPAAHAARSERLTSMQLDLDVGAFERSLTAGLPETIQPRDAVHVTRPSMGVNT